MSVPADCWREVWQGTLPGGETWQTGFWLQGNAPTSNASAQSAAQLEFDSIDDATSGPWNIFKTLVPSSVTLDMVKIFSYPSGGTNAQFVGQSSGTAKLGTAAGTPSINQAATVVTLRTGAAGRSHRGRMYLPGLAGAQISTGGLYGTTACTNLANRMATYFSHANAASGWGKIVVVSQKLTQALQVLQVTIDTRPDVQRRRANRMTGITRLAASVTP